jgi:hypothetical protein
MRLLITSAPDDPLKCLAARARKRDFVLSSIRDGANVHTIAARLMP